MLLPNYKPAVLVKSKNDWHIRYSYLIPGTTKYKRFKERFDMNRLAIKDRVIYGKSAESFMNEKLASGFNPFTIKKRLDKTAGVITEQIEFLLDSLIKDRSDSYKASLICMNGRLMRFVQKNELSTISINQVDVDMVNNFKKHLLAEKLARKTINSTLSHLGQFWDLAIETKMAFSNPFRAITKLKKNIHLETDDDIFEPLTFEEMDMIVKYYNMNGQRDYLRWVAFILWAWARPIEICKLKVNHIDLTRDLILFRKSETKTAARAYVQIVPPLKKMLLELQLDKMPGDYYLFSEDYRPGAKQLGRKAPGRYWNRTVKKILKINKNMYALKHTGNIEYLLRNKSNANLKWQQMQNRHTSSAMTDRYNRKLGAYFIDMGDLNFREM